MAGAFCGNIDLSKIDKADFVANNDFVWVKSEVLEKIYKIDDAFHTVIIFNNGCFATQCQLDQQIGDALLWVAINVMAAQGDLFGNVTVPSGVAVNICGVPDQDKFKKALTAVDVNAVNQFGFQPAAIMPLVAAIPLRSNIKIYGPYPSANFGLCGGATVESDPDLCPWVFGSAALMDAAGQAKANSMNVTPLSIAETGTITIPEMPSSNLGSQLGNGPNLTGINVSFGSSGVTSTYSYQTYTPKPGGFTRLFIDRLKNVAKYRQQQIKFLRNNAIDLNKINRRLRIIRGFNQQNNNLARQRANQPTAERVLVGEIYDFHPDTSGQRTVVAATTLPKAIQEMRYDFEKKAYMSLDGLYGPVSVAGDGGLPQYAKYSGTDENPPCHKSSPTLPYAPFALGNSSVDEMDMNNYNLEIYQRGLNPVTNPGDNPNSSNDSSNSGHVIDMLGRSSGSLNDGFIMNFYLGDNAGQQYEQDYRFLGMRGPLLLHSWGYDTQGKPIPNEADTDDDAKVGSFKNTNNKDKFLKDWLQKPSTWPVAPVDLRFDRDRGLWVSPPSYKIVVAKLEDKLESYGKAKASIITKNTEKDLSYGRPLIDATGEEVKSQEDESDAKIIVVDRIGQSYPKDSLVYVYYDTHTCEYIILTAPSKSAVRFRLYGCKKLEASTPSWQDGDNWTEVAGFFDKKPNGHSLAIRIDCDGNAVNRKGELLQANDIDINSPDKKDIFINVFDTAGKWGPSFAGYLNFEHWTNNASAGFGIVCDIPPSGCSMGVSPDCNQIDPDLDSYDIVYLESYARYIHGCLEQDLYISQEKANEKYPDDTWKVAHPSGNASVTVSKYYGSADNGQEPKIYDNNGNDDTIPIRVFDPWVDSNGDPISCYKPEDGPYYSAKSGTAFTAIFNEKTKRYELIQVSSQQEDNIVRFRLIDYCYGSGNGQNNTDPYAAGDTWMQYAGFNDKFTNSHSVAIKINCDGIPVDKNNEIVTALDIEQAIVDPNGDIAKRIFINVYDTVGRFGPSFNAYIIYGNPDLNYNQWIENAATGFATKYSSNPSGLSCNMGRTGNQCLDVNADYKSYEIIFLESYARFIECVLDQDLYPSESKLTDYSDDWYKTTYPSGNAAATIYDDKFYGDSPNGKEPAFFKVGNNTDIEPVSLRVFDPFIDDDIHKNPFRLLKEGDRVLCVFNDKLKKYTIYNSLDDGTRVVKFALVSDKLVTDTTAQAILINRDNKPITKDTKDLITDQDMFDDNIITVVDSYSPGNLLSAFGPALGSNNKDDHINGFNLYINCYNQTLFPFKGFALRRGSPTNEDGDITVSYEIINLEHYAKTIHGKAASIDKNISFNDKDYYLGLYNQYEDGVQPIARNTETLGIPNVYLEYTNTNFNGDHSYFVGRIADNADENTDCADAVDGCSFTAILNPVLSTSSFLVYTVVECEFLAIKGQTKVKTFTKADELNEGNISDSSVNDGVESIYRQGFMWDKVKSKSIYDKIAIKNRENWINKAKIIPSGILETSLIDIDSVGAPTYEIIFADTIAQVGEKYLTTENNPGLFGHPSYAVDDRVAKDTDKFYEGMDPTNLANNKPKFTLTNDQQWMTYEGAKIAGIWDETPGASVPNDGSYRIIYAQEAPIIITGTAISEFTPQDLENVQVAAIFPTCAGVDKAPIPVLLTKVTNPMGHGAKPGDYVTVQRVFTGVAQDGANYKYLVIGTGHPPGALKN